MVKFSVYLNRLVFVMCTFNLKFKNLNGQVKLLKISIRLSRQYLYIIYVKPCKLETIIKFVS